MKEAITRGYIEHLKTLNVVEACEIFEVSRWTLQRMVKDSNIKGKKKRGQIIYIRSELEKLFKPIQYNTIKLTLLCKGFKESKDFRKNDLEGQEKWLKKNKNRFEYNQNQFKAKPNNYVGWGKLKYSREVVNQ